MAHQSDLIAEDILAYLKSQEEKSMLRFITCGSVDDGKSTLIGRLLWDSKMIFEDQLAALESDSKKVGTQGEKIDYALLMDGLQAEREQGITIDVAYRFFSTDKRKFIVADTPGHEQYTRNMVTGASTADVAVILIDARKGILTQSRRHSYLVSLVGIRNVVLAINKMDLVDYSAARFSEIRQEYAEFAAGLGFASITAIPISALEGDNVLERSPRTDWYDGPTLMEFLESVEIATAAADLPFRLPVQWVNRPNLDFRGFAGTITAGTIRPGDEVVVPASGQKSRVKRIVTFDGDLTLAAAGQAVTLTLEDEIDISRGDLLVAATARPACADQFAAHLVWMQDEPLLLNRDYLLKIGATTVPVQISELQHKINVNTLEEEAGSTLSLNEIGVCLVSASKAITFDPYRQNRSGGAFILIDRFSNATVAAGMIDSAGRRRSRHWSEVEIDQKRRAGLKGQRARALWFTGVAGAEKLTVAKLVEKKLYSLGRHTQL
ncbi:MAG: sulfate adenylyltransferase subunit CysN, partial [Desulfuromonadales bacterium]|nr:sulfate adenylyltransferase subunit CysN [Desulfuromonadales bacterium]